MNINDLRNMQLSLLESIAGMRSRRGKTLSQDSGITEIREELKRRKLDALSTISKINNIEETIVRNINWARKRNNGNQSTY